MCDTERGSRRTEGASFRSDTSRPAGGGVALRSDLLSIAADDQKRGPVRTMITVDYRTHARYPSVEREFRLAA